MINFTSIKHGNDLLNYLLTRQDYTTLEELKTQLGLSRRGTFYVLKRVNEELNDSKLDIIMNLAGVGYFIPEETKKELLNQYSETQPVTEQFTKHQRCQLIAWDLINHKSLSLSDLTNRFQISKHTAISDLKSVRERLESHGLDIIQQPKGKHISGSEISQRNWVLEALNDRDSILYSQIDINPSRLIAINTEIHKLEKITGNYFSDDALSTLDDFILWFLERIKQPENQLPDSPLRTTNVDSMSINWSIKFLSDNNIHNFSESYFLGRIINTSQFYRVNRADGLIQTIFPISREIIDRFNTVSGANVSPEKLELTLSTHLLSTFYRSKFMIPYHHPNLEQITEGFRELFSFTKYAIRPFEKFINGHLSDDEIALIALYFGGELRAIESRRGKHVDVLVVCSSGIGTSYILQQQLIQHYPNIDFSQPLSVFQYKNQDLSNIKLIISTIELNVPVHIPIVRVSPLPNKKDWETIEKAFINAHLTDNHFNEASVNSLLDIISNYARIENFDGLTDALRGYLNQRAKLPIKKTTVTGPTSLQKLLPSSHITYADEELDNWKNVVQQALKPLLTEHLIEQRYIDRIIRLTVVNGPYMVLGNGIMLAHGTPNDGVNDLGMSLLLLQHPVTIENKDHADKRTIQIVIGLAPLDQTSHLSALSQLMQKIQDDHWVQQIKNADSVAEIANLLS